MDHRVTTRRREPGKRYLDPINAPAHLLSSLHATLGPRRPRHCYRFRSKGRQTKVERVPPRHAQSLPFWRIQVRHRKRPQHSEDLFSAVELSSRSRLSTSPRAYNNAPTRRPLADIQHPHWRQSNNARRSLNSLHALNHDRLTERLLRKPQKPFAVPLWLPGPADSVKTEVPCRVDRECDKQDDPGCSGGLSRV